MLRQLVCGTVVLSIYLLLAPQAFAVHGHGRSPQADNAARAGALQLKHGQPPRTYRPLVQPHNRLHIVARADWRRFKKLQGNRWTLRVDGDTGAAAQLYGQGLIAPGVMASPAVAEAFAGQFLASYGELFAPGTDASDLRLVANHLSPTGVRTLGYHQYADGYQVIGGQLSFRFKNDRLVMVASSAFPGVMRAPRSLRRQAGIVQPGIGAIAGQWIADTATVRSISAEPSVVILPIVRSGQAIEYRYVRRATVDAIAPRGQWTVYIDAITDEVVARVQNLRFASATMSYIAPERYPGGGRESYLARDAAFTTVGQTVITDGDGVFSWDSGQLDFSTTATGPRVRVVNVAGAAASDAFVANDGDDLVWARPDAGPEAQLATFIHTSIVKDYARSFAPALEFLDQQLIANVNIDDSCNAFFGGGTINFFTANDDCENTGLLADVVYHEFGHALHANSIIEGVGAFDGAFSEGLSDYLAATITDDSGMGRGFFYSSGPLREINPVGEENVWPRDLGGVHFTGLIFAGAMWDLRQELITKHGDVTGVEIANRLYYAAVQRATSIPTTFAEILVEDDDDGDLANGTPNMCEIKRAFAAHGLRDTELQYNALGHEAVDAAGHVIEVAVSAGGTPTCAGEAVSSARVIWQLRDDDTTGDEIAMTETEGSYAAMIPSPGSNQVVQYRVVVDFADGSSLDFPRNPADTFYEFYVGELETLYCTDFETDPFADGWTAELLDGMAHDWEWGQPAGLGGDPDAAYSGISVLGTDLGLLEGADGKHEANVRHQVLSPSIDVGDYTDVRLQYWRWLEFEDSFYDEASIWLYDSLGRRLAWRNARDEDTQSTHHLDGEWRFHDVALSELARSKELSVGFEINTDGGLEFGGWTLDSLCIVANPNSICGDGEVTGAEQCDDGEANSDTDADGCRSLCKAAFCGDGIVDSGEDCDDGNTNDDGTCPGDCTIAALNDGCCQTSAPVSPVSLLAAVFVLWLVTRRRKRGITTVQ